MENASAVITCYQTCVSFRLNLFLLFFNVPYLNWFCHNIMKNDYSDIIKSIFPHTFFFNTTNMPCRNQLNQLSIYFTKTKSFLQKRKHSDKNLAKTFLKGLDLLHSSNSEAFQCLIDSYQLWLLPRENYVISVVCYNICNYTFTA